MSLLYSRIFSCFIVANTLFLLFLARLYEYTGRAIALPPASALVVAVVWTVWLSFMLKFFKVMGKALWESYPVHGQVFLLVTVESVFKMVSMQVLFS